MIHKQNNGTNNQIQHDNEQLRQQVVALQNQLRQAEEEKKQQQHTIQMLQAQLSERSSIQKGLNQTYETIQQQLQDRVDRLVQINEILLKEFEESRWLEEAYHKMVDFSLQGLMILQNNRIVFANETLAHITGYTIQELLSLEPEDVELLFHPNDRALIWQRQQLCLSGQSQPSRYEYRIMHKDGHTRWVEVFTFPIEYQKQPAAQIAWIDITERKRAEYALNKERARFKWVVEHADDGFLIVDKDDAIVYTNQQARVYLNLDATLSNSESNTFSSEQFLGIIQKQYNCHPFDDFVSSEQQNDVSQQPTQYLVRPETSESNALWIQFDTLDLPDEEQTDKLIRLRDVSEQMMRERQMWTFHALISHKLNTPLSSLINSLYLLQDDTGQWSEQEQREFVGIALGSAQDLHKQLYRIRHFLNVPQLARPGEECPTNRVPDMIEQVAQELNLASVQTSYDTQLCGDYLVLPKQSMELLLRQVLENTQKFHPNHAPEVQIVLTCPNNTELCLQVYDNGSSLTPDQLQRVWSPYYQAEKNFSGQIPGMGLGLAIVATLLWNVGGQYCISNRASGPGVLVEMRVPIAQRETIPSS